VYYCIVNPVAGRGKGRRLISVIESFFASHGKAVEISEEFVAEKALKSQGIICVGGDGTLQEVVSGMLTDQDKCEIPLCVIPCGSGNDWQRSMNVNKTPEACLQALIDGKSRAIDAIRANKSTNINIANLGLDVEIVKHAQPLKKLFGTKSYTIAAIISIMRHKNKPLTLYIDGEQYASGNFTLVAICNGQYYGGGMRIAPSAVIDDGKITLCIISALSRLQCLTLFPLVLLERHTQLKAIKYIDCQKVTIIPKNQQSLSLDGNIYEPEDILNFEILPSAIQISV